MKRRDFLKLAAATGLPPAAIGAMDSAGQSPEAAYTKSRNRTNSHRSKPTARHLPISRSHSMNRAESFMFATGIECSIPTINHGRTRVDEMESCGHYDKWELDFDLVKEMGMNFLRYGPPMHKAWLSRGKYDWSFTDATFGRLRELDIVPIVDLCHFGVPDWIGNFQNAEFPELFEEYARAFAKRFPWVQLYTPVNEMYICVAFSARFGWWNEQLTTDRAFVTALKHVVKANVLAMHAILDVRPDAI